MGLNLNWCNELNYSDVSEVKKHLLQWAEHNPNGIFLFDTRKMAYVYNKMTEKLISGKITKNSLEIEELLIVWSRLEGTKGVLKSIYRNSQKIYSQPKNWEGSVLWYQFN